MNKVVLKCPVCDLLLNTDVKTLKCSKGHSFDRAKQGYTNLFLKSSQNSGDNKEMVDARLNFLNKGHYQPLLDALKQELNLLDCQTIVDLGCGEGFYTSGIKNDSNLVIGIDISKKAISYASRNYKNIEFVLASIYDVPVFNTSTDLCLNIFAPYPKEEIKRILKPGGYLVKIDPAANHLIELKQTLYETPYLNDEKKLDDMKLVREIDVNFTMNLNNNDLMNLFIMTPYYYKTSQTDRQKLINKQKLDVLASFKIYIYQK